MHCALWSECVWCIVDASKANTKFILSDNPVTVYNKGCFPKSHWCKGVNDPDIWLNGTHTIFPLSLNKALILTNLSWARNPYGTPTKERPNPRLFDDTFFNFTAIQTNRFLSDDEVILINYIIKKRCYRYIAASKKEWLYPENHVNIKKWDDIGSKYVLMPDPRSMTFTSEIYIGYKNRPPDAYDSYGRKPSDHRFNDKAQKDQEWETFHAFQGEYARLFGPKRRGITYEFGGEVLEEKVDSEDFHAYHLSCEQQFKKKKKRRKKKRN